jgi:hypothetical protein
MRAEWFGRSFGKRATLCAPGVHMRPGSPFDRRMAGVLSVAKLTLGQEAYYEQQVAGGLDDYYAGRGESPGIWAGSGSAGLGLVGVVEDGHLGTVLRGVNPANEERLRSAVRKRTITVRTLDVATVAGGATSRSGSRPSPATTSSSRARRASASCTRCPTTNGSGGK